MWPPHSSYVTYPTYVPCTPFVIQGTRNVADHFLSLRVRIFEARVRLSCPKKISTSSEGIILRV